MNNHEMRITLNVKYGDTTLVDTQVIDTTLGYVYAAAVMAAFKSKPAAEFTCSTGLCHYKAQPAPVRGDSDRINWLTNNPVDALDIFGRIKGADAVRWIRQDIDNAMAAAEKGQP